MWWTGFRIENGTRCSLIVFSDNNNNFNSICASTPSTSLTKMVKRKIGFACESPFKMAKPSDPDWASKVVLAILEEAQGNYTKIRLSQSVKNGSFPDRVLKRMNVGRTPQSWEKVQNIINYHKLREDIHNFFYYWCFAIPGFVAWAPAILFTTSWRCGSWSSSRVKSSFQLPHFQRWLKKYGPKLPDKGERLIKLIYKYKKRIELNG